MRTMPTCSPFGPTRRTSGTRMRSLMRVSVLMGSPRFDVVGATERRPDDPTEPRHGDDSRGTAGGPNPDTVGGGWEPGLHLIALTPNETRDRVVAFRRVPAPTVRRKRVGPACRSRCRPRTARVSRRASATASASPSAAPSGPAGLELGAECRTGGGLDRGRPAPSRTRTRPRRTRTGGECAEQQPRRRGAGRAGTASPAARASPSRAGSRSRSRASGRAGDRRWTAPRPVRRRSGPWRSAACAGRSPATNHSSASSASGDRLQQVPRRVRVAALGPALAAGVGQPRPAGHRPGLRRPSRQRGLVPGGCRRGRPRRPTWMARSATGRSPGVGVVGGRGELEASRACRRAPLEVAAEAAGRCQRLVSVAGGERVASLPRDGHGPPGLPLGRCRGRPAATACARGSRAAGPASGWHRPPVRRLPDEHARPRAGSPPAAGRGPRGRADRPARRWASSAGAARRPGRSRTATRGRGAGRRGGRRTVGLRPSRRAHDGPR